jgi:hypothetical protein
LAIWFWEASMRIFCSFLFVFAGVFSSTVVAQKPRAPLPPPQGAPESHLVRDGGVSETLQSIFIPPKADAPFELTLQTEWVKSLSDGGTITLENQRRIARDSKGRIYEERWSLVPRAGKFESTMTVIQIADPATHILYNCFRIPAANARRFHMTDRHRRSTKRPIHKLETCPEELVRWYRKNWDSNRSKVCKLWEHETKQSSAPVYLGMIER